MMTEKTESEVEVVAIAAVGQGKVITARARDGWRVVSSEASGTGRRRLTFARGPEILLEQVARELQEAEAKLKPCPFCAGVGFSRGEYVVCRTCGCEGPSGESDHHGMIRWNQRVAGCGPPYVFPDRVPSEYECNFNGGVWRVFGPTRTDGTGWNWERSTVSELVDGDI